MTSKSVLLKLKLAPVGSEQFAAQHALKKNTYKVVKIQIFLNIFF